ncbi:MAG: lysine--tRNA ligase [Planctomycetota bacterium]|nr:MAG: lysine--tRNA ligase [Planctomycetota bacterium]
MTEPTTDTPTAPSPDDLHQLEAQRRINRDATAALGVNPYGQRTEGLVPLAEARARYDEDADLEYQEKGKEEGFVDRRPVVRVAGRIVLRRPTGKLIWMNLRDHTDDSFQVAVSKRDCDELGFAVATNADLGDLVVVEGPLMKTRTGEVTLWASSMTPAAKCLVPPPEKHAGLTDPELRARKRYIDMWANPETTRTLLLRSKIVAAIRRLLDSMGFVEVETPMLQTQAGGAAARPFLTHLNALDIPLSLRIAPELYLKRLLVGGIPKVYEINRNFRNEGVDKRHNPEFTAIELYEAYGDVNSVMHITEAIIRESARVAVGAMNINRLRTPKFNAGKYGGESIGRVMDIDQPYIVNLLDDLEHHKDRLPLDVYGALTQAKLSPAPLEALRFRSAEEADLSLVVPFGSWSIDYSKPFVRVTYADLFERALGFPMTDTARARQEAQKRHLKTKNEKGEPLDDLWVVNELFEEVAEKLIDPARPTWVMRYPAALSPLTRPCQDDPAFADRSDLFIAGMEVGPHYTELNDPDIQAAKFREQLAGIDDEESTFRNFDHDFIEALKVGMPPAGGMGLGIDRLAMLMSSKDTIREVIPFPFVRPLNN